MKILSLDTSSNICGVSILDNTNLITHMDIPTGRTHSENLMPMIKDIFNKSNLQLKDIDLIVNNIGPGSFTGLRISSATVKAFSDAFNIPTIGVTSLESLTYNINSNGIVVSLLTSSKNTYFYGIYLKDNKDITILQEPNNNTLDHILEQLSSIQNLDISNNNSSNNNNPKIIFIGDDLDINKGYILQHFPTSILSSENESKQNSFSLGLAGLNNYTKHIKTDILPTYLKKPEAQIQLEEKEKLETNN